MKDMTDIPMIMQAIGDQARAAAAELAFASAERKHAALISAAHHVWAARDEIIAANPAQVEKAKQNPKLAGWFVGQVMKATGGKANPKAVNEIVSAKLGL